MLLLGCLIFASTAAMGTALEIVVAAGVTPTAWTAAREVTMGGRQVIMGS
jgi:hypothetical protein